MNKEEARRESEDLLARVGIPDSARRIKQYPHQFSGGMRQRVMIAMALSCNPRLIIADEPTTALDVTIQAQILDLMKTLTQEFGVALIIITHNLGVVARYADRMNIMYAGKIIERGGAMEIYSNPRHPYTIGLLNSVPRLDQPRRAKLEPIEGQPPDFKECIECARGRNHIGSLFADLAGGWEKTVQSVGEKRCGRVFARRERSPTSAGVSNLHTLG